MDKKEIIIGDKNLEKAIMKELGITNRDIVKADMPKLKRLSCSYTTSSNWLYQEKLFINDLTGLEHAVNLEQLSFRVKALSDVSILNNCKRLKGLGVHFEKAENIDSVLKLGSLTSLYLSWKNVFRMSSFEENNTKISYIRFLTSMFAAHGLGASQRLAIEKFYFSKSKKSAIEAIRETPKAAVFVKDCLSDKEILDEIKSKLSETNTPIKYARDLIKLPEYKDKLAEIIASWGNNKIKKFYMEFELKN